jgi:hypothetical protein
MEAWIAVGIEVGREARYFVGFWSVLGIAYVLGKRKVKR